MTHSVEIKAQLEQVFRFMSRKFPLHLTPKNKWFWRGYLSGLNDFKLLSDEDELYLLKTYLDVKVK